MIADKKTFTLALVILLSLITVGVIQLYPPETPKSAPNYYYRNMFLVLDLLEEEVCSNNPDAPVMLQEHLHKLGLEEEAELWQKYGSIR